MRVFTFVLVLCLACLVGTPPANAQEGHPLKGSWIGTWAGNKIHSPDVVVVLNWDGKTISGMINPGTDNMPIKNATLNPEGWIVHLEADAKDKSGSALTYVIDGKIENIHLPKRTITGTWKNQKETGAFNVERQ
jgi:hypothetical protein